MSDYLDLADEISALPPNTALRMAPNAQRVIVWSLKLVEKVDEMMAILGHHGEISARDDRVQAVMDLLHKIDPQ